MDDRPNSDTDTDWKGTLLEQEPARRLFRRALALLGHSDEEIDGLMIRATSPYCHCSVDHLQALLTDLTRQTRVPDPHRAQDETSVGLGEL